MFEDQSVEFELRIVAVMASAIREFLKGSVKQMLFNEVRFGLIKANMLWLMRLFNVI